MLIIRSEGVARCFTHRCWVFLNTLAATVLASNPVHSRLRGSAEHGWAIRCLISCADAVGNDTAACVRGEAIVTCGLFARKGTQVSKARLTLWKVFWQTLDDLCEVWHVACRGVGPPWEFLLLLRNINILGSLLCEVGHVARRGVGPPWELLFLFCNISIL